MLGALVKTQMLPLDSAASRLQPNYKF